MNERKRQHKVHAVVRGMSHLNREERLAALGKYAGRPIATTNDLTDDELTRVLRALRGVR